MILILSKPTTGLISQGFVKTNDIIIQANIYADLVEWEDLERTEPPLTMDFTEETILSAMASRLHLPKYRNDTQSVERYMPVLEQACGQRVGATARDQFIHMLNKSRELVPKFDSKKNDSKF